MELNKNFIGIFVSILFLFRFVSLNDNEISALTGKTDILVDQIEQEVISEQTHFDDQVSKALSKTKATQKLLSDDSQVKKLNSHFKEIVSILNKLVKTKDFTLSNFASLNKVGCKKIKKIVSRLEDQVDLCLKLINSVDRYNVSLDTQVANLKIEYSVSFIQFSKSTANKVLKNISELEKLVVVITEFSSHLYAAGIQIANVLYDIKVVKFRDCDTKVTTTKSVKSKTKTKSSENLK